MVKGACFGKSSIIMFSEIHRSVVPRLEHSLSWQSMDGSHEPNGLKLDSRSQAAWAKYFSKWIEAYHASDIPIWGITVQNEPEFPAPWEACK